MRILGHGVDIVSVPRIAGMVQRHGEQFLNRVFCAGELEYARGRPREHEHLAGRFAVKEAVLKALGTGWRSGIAWTDVEVVLDPAGAPRVKLAGEAQRLAAHAGIDAWSISISHTPEYAIASAIATGPG